MVSWAHKWDHNTKAIAETSFSIMSCDSHSHNVITGKQKSPNHSMKPEKENCTSPFSNEALLCRVRVHLLLALYQILFSKQCSSRGRPGKTCYLAVANSGNVGCYIISTEEQYLLKSEVVL